jgi:Mitochondrial carrier protein
VGSAISNVLTYPLDLIITRLQTHRQLRAGSESTGADEDEYKSIQAAVQRIYDQEGGISGFYTGLVQDTSKTIADSFLFFLAYNFLRRRRMSARSVGGSEAGMMLPVLDELGIGIVAGSLTKLLTTPISNVVTRKQTSALTIGQSTSISAAESAQSRLISSKVPSTSQIAREILQQKGILGFWSGYSASLILSLNPSLTFLLFETFKRLLLPRWRRENPPPWTTFLMAAISKACASSVTYPFSVAKARAQVSANSVSSSDASPSSISTHDTDEKSSDPPSTTASNRAAGTSIFSSLVSIVRSDGPKALYSGLFLELIKSFLSHGTTMILKQYVHGIIMHAYYILSLMVARLRSTGLKAGAQTEKLVERAREQRFEYYDLARDRAEEKLRMANERSVEYYDLARRRAQEARAKADGIMGVVSGLGGDLVGKANETADLVGDYVEEEAEEWRELYGTGLARWFDEK